MGVRIQENTRNPRANEFISSSCTLITQMADDCLECEASICVWLAFSCREESVTTYIESVQISQKCQALNANIFL